MLASPGRIGALGALSNAGGGAAATKIIGLSGDMDFGEVGVSDTPATTTMTIANTGDSDLTVTSIDYPEGYSGTYSGVIGAGMSDDVEVTFDPTAAQEYNGTITVNSDATSGTNTIGVTGEGVLTAQTADYYPNTPGVLCYEYNEISDYLAPPNSIDGDNNAALSSGEEDTISVNDSNFVSMSIHPGLGGFRIVIPIAQIVANIQSLVFDFEVSDNGKGGPGRMSSYLWDFTGTPAYDDLSASVVSATKASISKTLSAGITAYIDGSGNLSIIVQSERSDVAHAPQIYYHRTRANYLG